MDVILCQDIKKVGKEGDIVKVKPGYARNYLLPKKMAYIATAENLQRIKKLKDRKAQEFAKAKQEAEALAERLRKLSCTVSVEVNDLDKLYGSVTEQEIVKALEVEGYTFDKKYILLENPIDELGIFDVTIKLHPEVSAKVKLWVAKK